MAPMATRAKKDDEPGRAEGEAAPEGTAKAEGGSKPEASRPEGSRKGPARHAPEVDPLAALIEGLEEVLPGLEVLDRELVFEGGARADLALIDPAGRLHLVLLAAEEPRLATLEVLDALAVLRRDFELLARHLGSRRLTPARAPRLFVIATGADATLVERLSSLGSAGVEVFGLRAVKSAAGERSYLVRLGPAAQDAGTQGGVEAFLEALPARLAPLGREFVTRMERLDEELDVVGDSSALVWRLQGEVLCRLEQAGERLTASVAPEHASFSLALPGDLERVLERCLERLVAVLGLARGDRPDRAGPKPLAPEADEPLLTDEEIQAFRE